MENQVEKAPQKHAPASGESSEASFESGSAMQLQAADHPNMIAQRKVQEAANSSLQVQQLKTLQLAANNSAQVQNALQLKAAANSSPVQRKENNTGLPDNLKSGIESLSGMSMDHVQVNYNSDKPAQLNAHAYAQGSEIHVASGQEKHLPHEAWHVVQQAQGRVKPTQQLKGKTPINDDAGLEKEADVMGAKALQMKGNEGGELQKGPNLATQIASVQRMMAVFQLQVKPVVVDQKLKNIVNALFKAAPAGGAAIGDGSALAACTHEVGGGAQVGGCDHIQKCQDLLNGVTKLIGKHNNAQSPVNLSPADLLAATKLEQDLKDAIAGTYAG
jgi:hypothetical protein